MIPDVDPRYYTVTAGQAEPRKGPIRCNNCKKSASEGGSHLRKCACLTVYYCSRECQRRAWEGHKVDCKRVTSGEFKIDVMSYPAESGGVMTHQNARTIGRVLQDLATWAEILEDKNGALTLVAWQALGLLLDIEARKTKMLLLGLCRTTSNDPRTYYKLKEACVVPVADAKRIFKHLSPNPARMLKEQEEKLPKDLIGAIGAMMVVNVEQAEDDPRPVLEAASKFSTIMCTPLGVFDAFRTDFQPLGQYTEAKWKASFSNVLRGGLFTTPFRRTP